MRLGLSCTLAVAGLFFIWCPVQAERLSVWKNYTNTRDVTGLAAQGDTLWVASRGGLARILPGDPPVERRFTNADGLGGNDLRFVVLDSQRTLWTGGANGRLSRRRSDSRWDLYRFENDRGLPIPLNAASPGADGLLWIASDVGVHRFDTQRHGGEIKETYTRIGNWPDGAAVRDLLVQGGYLWVVGDAGAARAPVEDPFLLDRSHWKTWSGLENLTAIAFQDGTVYAGGTDGLFAYGGASVGPEIVDTQWVPTIFTPGTTTVRDLHSVQDTLWITSSAGLVWYSGLRFGKTDIPGASPGAFTSVVGTADGALWVGQQGMGLWRRTGAWSRCEFNGPLDNSFADAAVGDDGKVWCVHANYGADYLDGGLWTHLPYFAVGPSYPGTSVAVAPDGEVWFGAWGTGAYRVNPRVPLADTGWTRYDTANSTLTGIDEPGRPPSGYVVIRDVAVDPQGRAWFTNAFTPGMRSLAFYDHGCWGMFSSAEGMPSAQPTALWAAGDRVLLGTSDVGLVEVTYQEPLCSGRQPTVQGAHVRTWNTTSGLPANDVRVILVDRADSVWVGTNVGLARYAADRRRFFDIALPTEAGLTINTLAADAANAIWVGTTLGLVVIDPDGNMEYYNSTNSGLVGNAVSEITIDERSGMVWIATDAGLSQTKGVLPPAEAIADVVAYPNPFDLSTTGDARVHFNAEFGSRVYIFTAAGHPVIDFDAALGWDGRDSDGVLVASGIYPFVVTSPEGAQGRGKIAVRRRS